MDAGSVHSILLISQLWLPKTPKSQNPKPYSPENLFPKNITQSEPNLGFKKFNSPTGASSMDIQASSYGSISLIILVGLLTLLCFIAWSYTIQRDELLRCEKTHSRVVCLHTLNP